jgi:Arc/MetJ family transcription regulator
MQIIKRPRKAYSEAPEPIRGLLDAGAEELAAAANWKVRKKTMLDLIDDLRLAYMMLAVDRDTLVQALREELGEEKFNRLMERLIEESEARRKDAAVAHPRDESEPEPDASAPAAVPEPEAPGGEAGRPGEALDLTGVGEQADREVAEPDEAGEAESDDPRTVFGNLVQAFVGRVLERLDEAEITTAEQAAIYMLSSMPEHVAAAIAWMSLDPRRRRAVRKLARTDRRYADVLDIVESARLGGDLPEEP